MAACNSHEDRYQCAKRDHWLGYWGGGWLKCEAAGPPDLDLELLSVRVNHGEIDSRQLRGRVPPKTVIPTYDREVPQLFSPHKTRIWRPHDRGDTVPNTRPIQRAPVEACVEMRGEVDLKVKLARWKLHPHHRVSCGTLSFYWKRLVDGRKDMCIPVTEK